MHFELHKSEALNRQRYWLSSNEITDLLVDTRACFCGNGASAVSMVKCEASSMGRKRNGRAQSVHAFHGAIACGVTKGIHLFCLRSHLLGTS